MANSSNRSLLQLAIHHNSIVLTHTSLLCWFTVCCVGALETSTPPEEYRISFAFVSFNIVIDRCVQNTKKRTKLTLLLNQ